MVENKIIDALSHIGFSEYEAKAYISAVKIKPATAYEIAIESGIPSSKIYEVIARLAEKHVLFEVQENGKKKFVPLEPEELLDREKSEFEKTFSGLRENFSKIRQSEEVSFIYQINDYQLLLDKSRRFIGQAKRVVLISTWHAELEQVFPILKAAEERGVKIAVVHFGKPKLQVGTLFTHPIEDTIYSEKGGRGFTLVKDSEGAVMGTVGEDTYGQGAWSHNNGFVTLAEDYIKHDIYIMKIVHRFDKELISRFGVNYKHLRNIFSDREV